MRALTSSAIANSWSISWLVFLLFAVGSGAAQQEVDPNHFDSKPSAAYVRTSVLHLDPARPSLKGATRKRARARLKSRAPEASARRHEQRQQVTLEQN